MTRTDVKTPPANPHKHDHGLTATDKAIAELAARVAAVEKDAAVTKALLLASIGAGSFHPPVNPPAGPASFIAPTGSDSTGDGTIGSPWRSLQHFYDQAGAGDLLYCRGGTYPANTQTVVDAVSGTAGSPITVAAYPGETPVFPGGVGYNALHFDGGVSYHVVDGLHFTGYAPTSGAIIWVGHTDGAEAGPTLTHHITFRNLYVTKGTGGNHQSHGLYNSWMSDHVTLEDSTLIGASEFDDGNAAVHAYHPPNVTNLLVQRCILDGWMNGFLLWDGDPPPAPRRLTASLLHNTIVNCDTMIRLEYHAAVTVRDNVGDPVPGGTSLYDPNDGGTTADHNYWAETLSGYALQAGSSAINGASDGSDAGAVDYVP